MRYINSMTILSHYTLHTHGDRACYGIHLRDNFQAQAGMLHHHGGRLEHGHRDLRHGELLVVGLRRGVSPSDLGGGGVSGDVGKGKGGRGGGPGRQGL